MAPELADDPMVKGDWAGVSRFGALEQKVISLDQSIIEIKTNFLKIHDESVKEIKEDFKSLELQLSELHKAVAASRIPNYAVMAAVGTVLLAAITGIGNMALDPMRQNIFEIKETMKTIVPRETHLFKWAEYDKQILEIQAELKLLDTTKLKASDMVDRLADLKSKIDDLNGRLEQLRKR